VKFDRSGSVFGVSNMLWYDTYLYAGGIYRENKTIIPIIMKLFGHVNGGEGYLKCHMEALNTCGIFNHTIVDNKIKLYALIQFINTEWDYLGGVDGGKKACRYTIDICK